MGWAKPVVPLTDEQRQYATEHHNIIYQFLWKNGLPIDDFYDVAVFGYLNAVRKNNPSLGFRFSPLAHKCMKDSCIDEIRKRHSQMRTAEIMSLDDSPDDCDELYSAISSLVSVEDIAVSNIAARDIVSQLDEKQRKTVLYSLLGYTFQETGKRERIGRVAAWGRIKRIRRQLVAGGYLDGKTQGAL